MSPKDANSYHKDGKGLYFSHCCSSILYNIKCHCLNKTKLDLNMQKDVLWWFVPSRHSKTFLGSTPRGSLDFSGAFWFPPTDMYGELMGESNFYLNG